MLALLLGAAGAGLVLLSARQAWAHVMARPPAPLPATTVPVSGQDLVPAAGALGLAALAGLAAVIATRGLPRRLVGGLLAVFGLVITVAVVRHAGQGEVLAAARSAVVSQAGSVTSGGPGATSGTQGGVVVPAAGSGGRVLAVGFPWRALAAAGSLAVIAAGALAAWHGPRWPGMSSRYDRRQPDAARPGPGGSPAPGPPPAADSAGMWESLTRGVDPTAGPPGPGNPGAAGTREGKPASGG